jgi:hypothetical protein
MFCFFFLHFQLSTLNQMLYGKIYTHNYHYSLFATITHAQITKGSLYLGGNIGVSVKSEEVNVSSPKGKSTSLSINPAIGIAVKTI